MFDLVLLRKRQIHIILDDILVQLAHLAAYQLLQHLSVLNYDIGIQPPPLKEGYGVQLFALLQKAHQHLVPHVLLYDQDGSHQPHHFCIFENLCSRDEVAGDGLPLVDQQFDFVVIGKLASSELLLYQFDGLELLLHVILELHYSKLSRQELRGQMERTGAIGLEPESADQSQPLLRHSLQSDLQGGTFPLRGFAPSVEYDESQEKGHVPVQHSLNSSLEFLLQVFQYRI